MFSAFPDTPTPVGCLVGFLALFPAAVAGLAFWGAYKAFTANPPLPETGKTLLLWGGPALLLAVAGFAFAVYKIATTGKGENL